MASLTKVLSFTQLYDDHASNPVGTTEDEIAEAYFVIYTTRRTSDKTTQGGGFGRRNYHILCAAHRGHGDRCRGRGSGHGVPQVALRV
jgi:hypothetical protein